MAFSYTIEAKQHINGAYIVEGTWDAAGVTSGNIKTGLTTILFSNISNDTSDDHGIIDDQSTAGTIALTSVTSNDTGRWFALGK